MTIVFKSDVANGASMVPYWDEMIAQEIEFFGDGTIKRIVYRPFSEWHPDYLVDFLKNHSWESKVVQNV